MKNVAEYIESGIIEAYVMGIAPQHECEEVENFASKIPAVKYAIHQFSLQLEDFALNNAIEPDPIVKPMVMASFDFMQRLADGEKPSFPPLLNPQSSIADFNEWLQRSDMKLKNGENGVFAKIIGYTSQVTTAIVWLKDLAPQEVHHNEYERFLIVEGTCNIQIGSKVHSLKPGDFLEIPLHTSHSVKVTSSNICKVVLQRVAA